MAERPSEKQIANSLEACYKEGMAAQPVTTAFDYYLIPFGLSLGASTSQLGLLVSLPALVASLSFLLSVRVVRYFGSRLQLLTSGVGAQTGLILLMALLSVIEGPNTFALLLLLVAGFRMLGGLLGPTWGSLVSEYLPAERRASYFGRRVRAVHLSGISSLALWGGLLWVFQNRFHVQGFLGVFLGAGLFRFISYRYMTRMVDLPLQEESGAGSLWEFARDLRRSNVGRFVVYAALLTFATNVSGPYFSVRMLRELRFDYLSYTTVCLGSVLATIVAVPIWGRFADRVGTARILKLTGPLIGFIPLLWLFGRSPVQLMLCEMVSGFLWSGYDLCVAAYLYDAVPATNRLRTLAYFNLMNGTAVFAGASLGGVLVDRLPPMFGSNLLSLFFLSSMLRFAVNGLFVRGFQEPRLVEAEAPSLPALAGRLAGRMVVPLAVRPYRRARRRALRLVARVGRA